jgi:hypothetical protein
MGAFDTAPHISIPDDTSPEEAAAFRQKWGWEPHEMVFIRGAYTGIEQEAVDNASSGFKGKGKARKVDMRLGTARNKLLEVMITDWTFARNGRKEPVTPGAIIRLPANYRKPILEKCDEIAQTMDEEDEEDFLASSNGHSQENSETESLSPMPS